MTSELEHALETVYVHFMDRLESIVVAAVQGAMATMADQLPAVAKPVERTAVSNTPAKPAKVGGIAEWESVSEMPIVSGSRTYIIKVGYPCKVKGLGRGGATGSGWFIVGITKRGDEYNVEVNQGRGTTVRFVKGNKILYQRPKTSKEHTHE